MSLDRIMHRAEEARFWSDTRRQEQIQKERQIRREFYELMRMDISEPVMDSLEIKIRFAYPADRPWRYAMPEVYAEFNVGNASGIIRPATPEEGESRRWRLQVGGGIPEIMGPINYDYTVSGEDLENELLIVIQELNHKDGQTPALKRGK